MSRERLIEMARVNIAHSTAGTVAQTPDVLRVPVERYTDPERWQREVDRVFKRLPLLLATTAEVARPGSYKALEACGVPVLISRGSDGQLRAFVNMCSHRGAVLMPAGHGEARSFVCPYHAWSYGQDGTLLGIRRPEDFGEIDKSCHGLTSLPVTERAGLVWVQLEPEPAIDVDTFLCGYDEMLAHFGFDTWQLFDQREIRGPNWKIAYDGYLDLYHLPVLHRESFGPMMPDQALYFPWGPHQVVGATHPMMQRLDDLPEADWPMEGLLAGVWTIFPHVSIASFGDGCRGVLISQLFPGSDPFDSVTIQTYLTEREPSEEERSLVQKQWELLEYVVREEDYATCLRQQRALQTGTRSHVLFGRNEGGGQRFHAWVDRLLETDDADLSTAFEAERR